MYSYATQQLFGTISDKFHFRFENKKKQRQKTTDANLHRRRRLSLSFFLSIRFYQSHNDGPAQKHFGRVWSK